MHFKIRFFFFWVLYFHSFFWFPGFNRQIKIFFNGHIKLFFYFLMFFLGCSFWIWRTTSSHVNFWGDSLFPWYLWSSVLCCCDVWCQPEFYPYRWFGFCAYICMGLYESEVRCGKPVKVGVSGDGKVVSWGFRGKTVGWGKRVALRKRILNHFLHNLQPHEEEVELVTKAVVLLGTGILMKVDNTITLFCRKQNGHPSRAHLQEDLRDMVRFYKVLYLGKNSL